MKKDIVFELVLQAELNGEKISHGRAALNRCLWNIARGEGPGIEERRILGRDGDLEDFRIGYELSERIWWVKTAAKSS